MIDLLIVDDEPEIREGIKNGINWKNYGINVCGLAESASEALELIEMLIPDIMILDVRMPKMDGLELLEIINAKYTNVKVILISAYDDFCYAQQAISLNAFCYLLKPLNPQVLLSKILEAKNAIEKQMEKLSKDKELNRKICENMPILRDNFFTQLISGKLTELNTVKEKADFLGIDISKKQFAILLFDIENLEASKNTGIHQKNLLKFAVINCTENIFKSLFNFYYFDFEEKTVFLICNDRIGQQQLYSMCCSIKSMVNDTLGLSLTIGIGNVCFSPINIPASYKQALEALKYKIVYGKNEIIEFRSITTHDRQTGETHICDILKDSQENLLNSLRANSSDEINKIVDNIIQAMQNALSVNINSKNWLLLLLTSFLTELLMSFNISTEAYFTGDNDLYGELKELQTIDELKKFILSFMGNITNELESRKKNHNNCVLNKALEYIKSNIGNDISLTSLASHLYIHPNYFSKLFKQQMGESYMDYITKQKMEKAKSMIENSNSKIYEIAEALSYKDVSHFIKVFKKTYGVSPSEYREIQALK